MPIVACAIRRWRQLFNTKETIKQEEHLQKGAARSFERKQVYESSPQPVILHSARCENTLIVEPDRCVDDPWGTRDGGKFRAVELTCWVVEIARQDDLRLIISMSHSFGKKNASSKWAHLPRFSVWKQHTCKQHLLIYYRPQEAVKLFQCISVQSVRGQFRHHI